MDQQILKLAAQLVATHRLFAHLAAHNHRTAPRAGGMDAIPSRQEGRVCWKQPQGDPPAMEALTLPIEAIEHSMAPETVLLGQGHKSTA